MCVCNIRGWGGDVKYKHLLKNAMCLNDLIQKINNKQKKKLSFYRFLECS